MEKVNADFWKFVDEHLNDDPAKLRLKYHGKQAGDFDTELAITQIECRKKFGKKLSETLAQHPHWLFPSLLSGEQSTSDRLADYHASLIADGSSVIDLTAGLGIDILHLSRKATKAVAVEIDKDKADTLRYNFKLPNRTEPPQPSSVIDTTLIEVVNADCRTFVERDIYADTIFIDPARRADDGSRVYAISRCSPDIIALLPRLKAITSKLIIKMSPMLDITQTLRDLPETSRIIALGTETECKELIAIVDFGFTPPLEKEISAVTLKNDGTTSTVSFSLSQEQSMDINSKIGTPEDGDFVYDPYPAVMKAAPYRMLTHEYDVRKMSNNTHLYFSKQRVNDFPGRTFRIVRILPYSSKHIKRLKKEFPKISITTRNFDMPADRLKVKLGVSDSNEMRLFAVTLSDSTKAMLICTII